LKGKITYAKKYWRQRPAREIPMDTLIPMALMLTAGVLWRYFEPGNIPVQQVRATMGVLVINLMAPALILEVILTSTLEQEFYQIPVTGSTTVAVVLCLSFALYSILLRAGLITRPQAGALLMASVFGNGMGIALPTVDALTGSAWSGIPFIYDLLVTVPFVWIVGVLLCAHFGIRVAGGGLGRELILMPPFWALIIALIFRQSDTGLPAVILKALHMLGTATIPLLLLMVGMSLKIGNRRHLLAVIPVLLLKLILSPVIAFYVGRLVGLDGPALIATILTAAAPAVVVGIALCDRFELDTELFCTALTLSTILYIVLASPVFTYLSAVAS
jgi:malate permease and related proteins